MTMAAAQFVLFSVMCFVSLFSVEGKFFIFFVRKVCPVFTNACASYALLCFCSIFALLCSVVKV